MQSGGLFRGVRDDFITRIEHYLSDWKDAFKLKVVASTLFIFFTSVAPAITFSLLLDDATDGQIGAIEVLLATSITGILFSLFAGQPLVIVGVTGPVAILTVTIYTLATQWGVNFVPFYAWSQIWAAFLLVALAAINACDSLKYVTRFSCEIFGILIALLYLYTGIEGIVSALANTNRDFSAGLLQFIISIGTLYVARLLSSAKEWSILTDASRELVSDYGATLSILLWSTVPTMAANRLQDDDIPTLFVPLKFETTSGRGWFVDFTDLPIWAIFAAAFPGLIIAILFFFDHNVSSLLAQDSELKLKKGSAFHLDFLVIGVGVLLTGLLGIPPTNGLIPQAPLHTKSLTVMKRLHIDGIPTNDFYIHKVHEQRLSNLLQSILCGVVCFRPFSDALREIPTSVLYGLFLFLGASSFDGNEFAYRMGLTVMDTRLRETTIHPYACVKNVSFQSLRNYTLVQAILCIIIFGITFTDAGVIFPVLIALLIAVRIYILPRWFSVEDLNYLDATILAADITDEAALKNLEKGLVTGGLANTAAHTHTTTNGSNMTGNNHTGDFIHTTEAHTQVILNDDHNTNVGDFIPASSSSVGLCDELDQVELEMKTTYRE